MLLELPSLRRHFDSDLGYQPKRGGARDWYEEVTRSETIGASLAALTIVPHAKESEGSGGGDAATIWLAAMALQSGQPAASP